MLTVPMLSAENEVIGVIQLINKKRDAREPPRGARGLRGQVVPFDERAEELALALASQAGISLENAMLYKEITQALRGLRRRVGDGDRVARSRRPRATRGAWRR